MSVQVVAEDSVPILMLVILAIISFAAHCLILFGGKLAHASKTYYYFTTKHTRLSQELAANHRLVRKRLKRLEAFHPVRPSLEKAQPNLQLRRGRPVR